MESPLLLLVENLANFVLSRVGQEGKFMLARVAVRQEGIRLDFQVAGTLKLVDGTYPLWFRVVETGPAFTRLAIEWGEGAGLARMAWKALGLVPERWINDNLSRILGDAVRWEDQQVVIEHTPLMVRLAAMQQSAEEPDMPAA